VNWRFLFAPVYLINFLLCLKLIGLEDSGGGNIAAVTLLISSLSILKIFDPAHAGGDLRGMVVNKKLIS